MKIGFTGHRPPKAFYRHNKAYTQECFNLLEEFLDYELIHKSYLKDVEIFNVGGALGFDTVVAEVLFFYKCKVNLYLPFKIFGSNWYSNTDRIRLEKHKNLANKVIYTSETNTYVVRLLDDRNKAIVDNSDIIIALWDGNKSGTKNCINYAEKKDKEVINLWNEWVKFYDNYR